MALKSTVARYLRRISLRNFEMSGNPGNVAKRTWLGGKATTSLNANSLTSTKGKTSLFCQCATIFLNVKAEEEGEEESIILKEIPAHCLVESPCDMIVDVTTCRLSISSDFSSRSIELQKRLMIHVIDYAQFGDGKKEDTSVGCNLLEGRPAVVDFLPRLDRDVLLLCDLVGQNL